MVCNGIKGDKTNTLKQETNYKPQTNGRYKVRHVLTKKNGKYTHTYTHISKTKTVKKKKIRDLFNEQRKVRMISTSY